MKINIKIGIGTLLLAMLLVAVAFAETTPTMPPDSVERALLGLNATEPHNESLPDFDPEVFEKMKQDPNVIETRGKIPRYATDAERRSWLDKLDKIRIGVEDEMLPYDYPNGSVISYGFDWEGYFYVGLYRNATVNASLVNEIYGVIDREAKAIGVQEVPVAFSLDDMPQLDSLVLNNSNKNTFMSENSTPSTNKATDDATDWNMLGKDAGHTSYTADSIVPPLKTSWAFDLGYRSPGFGQVEPVVSNNTVYTSGITVDGQNIQDWLFALNASTGKLLWKYKTNWDIRGIAVLGDVVVVSDDMNIYALSNGTEKWKREVGSGDQPPIIYKNLVLSGQAFALSLENGSLVWTYEPELPGDDETHLVNNWARPLAAGEDKVILAIESIQTYYTGPRVPTATEAPKPGEKVEIPPEPPQNISTIIFALDAETGKEEWVKRIPLSIESAPVISKGKLFVGSNDSVQAYLLEDGKELWRTVLPGFRRVEAVKDNILFTGGTALNTDNGKKVFTYESALSSPSLTVSGNTLYIGGSSISALIEALNASTGEFIWHGVKVQGYNSASKPVISGDKLFLISQDGKLYAFSHGTLFPGEYVGSSLRAPSLSIVLSIFVLLGAFLIIRRRIW